MNPSRRQLQKLDAFLCQHVFGYQWYLFTSKDGSDKWCSLLKPETWIPRHGGKQIDYPADGDVVDMDVPAYSTDPAKVAELIEQATPQSLTLHVEHQEEGWSIWSAKIDSDKDVEFEFYPTLSLALCMFLIDLTGHADTAHELLEDDPDHPKCHYPCCNPQPYGHKSVSST